MFGLQINRHRNHKIDKPKESPLVHFKRDLRVENNVPVDEQGGPCHKDLESFALVEEPTDKIGEDGT